MLSRVWQIWHMHYLSNKTKFMKMFNSDLFWDFFLWLNANYRKVFCDFNFGSTLALVSINKFLIIS